jgi:tRNA nucleotidyltransferase (CCA-adding enzyme)
MGARENTVSLPEDLPAPIPALAAEVAGRGGRAYLVGGFVRDLLLGSPSKDLDVEVFGLSVEELEEILAPHGEVIRIGKAFGVLRVKGLDVDFSVPRRDSKVGSGHRGFLAHPDPDMSPADAVRRRDLTINALLLDPLNGAVTDPAGGVQDLEARRLRAVDPVTFPEDPLRPLRVAQLAARLEFSPDEELLDLSRRIDLDELPPERVWDEWEKLLLRGRRPSLGLAYLLAADLLGGYPALLALVGTPQDPEWHPEGDVWEHTLRAVDAAAGLRTGDRDEDLQLMLGSLCHDLGKGPTTSFLEGRWRSYRHDVEGEALVEAVLAQMGAPARLLPAVQVLVRRHLIPAWYSMQGAQPRSYRRLARELDAHGTRMTTLERVARADSLGRTTPDALAGSFEAGDTFLEAAEQLQIRDEILPDVVLGRHLIGRGLHPGPRFGPLLARCREIQDEEGWDDPDRILDRALEPNGEEPGPQNG